MEATTAATLAAIFAGAAAVATWAGVYFNYKNITRTLENQTNNAARASRASVVSANRQKWIDALRDDIADLLTAVISDQLLAFDGSPNPTMSANIAAEHRAAGAAIRTLRARVDLRLNPAEDDHIELLGAIDAHIVEVSIQSRERVTSLTKKILKDEWERIKREAVGTKPIVRA